MNTDRELLFRLITRSLAVVCLLWAFSDVLSIGVDALGMAHYVHNLRTLPLTAYGTSLDRYYVRYYTAYALEHLIVCLTALLLARWLYRGGHRVARFFGVTEDS